MNNYPYYVNEYPYYNNYNNYNNDERFLSPLLVGGIAGTALGYGLANNNRPMFIRPVPYPVYNCPCKRRYPRF